MPVMPRISRDYVQTLSNEQLVQLVTAYADTLLSDAYSVWDMFIVTVMFHHIPGDSDHRKFIMQKELERVYSVLTSRLFRNPHSPTQYEKIPRWVMFADYSPVAMINDSLHYQGLGIFYPFNRHGVPVLVLVERFQSLLCGNHGLVERVHLERVTHNHKGVQRYCAKSILNRKSTFDDVVVFPPKAREEYRRRGSQSSAPVRKPQVLRLPQNLGPEQQPQPRKARAVIDCQKRRSGTRATF